MRLVATFLLCGVAFTAGAAEIWRWRDANGVVHYSDQPRAGAERILIETPRPPAEQPPPPEPPAQGAQDSGSQEGNASRQPFSYSSCQVVAPTQDENFQGVQPISVSLSVEPEVQPGHRIQLLVNGAALPDWPPTATQYTLPEVYRGSHTLSVRIVDARGRPVCSGPSITFHLRQQSVLPPAGRAPRPAQSGA
jgi:hypothetical protein